jgi:phosphate transport system substrate-binding protein
MRLVQSLIVGLVCVTGLASIVSAQVRVQGSGASFPDPLYRRWAVEFQKVDTLSRVDYTGSGSGKGISDITARTVDFAGSDAPLTRAEIAKLPAPVLQIPSCAGAVVMAYNLPEFSGTLNLSGEVVADIYLGKITRWNDSAIAALNPGVTLPDRAITPVFRSDSSGTTHVFTSYLTTQSREFTGKIGGGKKVEFPIGLGGAKNAGVAANVQQTLGSIGYVELNYAVENKMTHAAMKNTAGEFIVASPESVTIAASGALESMTSGKLTADIWNQSTAGAYPIAGFTYLFVYQDLGYMGDKARARAVLDFLRWATSDGQAIAGDLTYAPLPEPVRDLVREALDGVTFNGEPLR